MWQIGQIYIRTIIHPGSHPVAGLSSEASTLTLRGYDFWTLQAGVYANAANALQLKERLCRLGFPAIVVPANPTVVAVGMGESVDSLGTLRQKLQQAGIAVIPKHLVWPAESFRVSGANSNQVARLLKDVNEILAGPFKADAITRSLTAWEEANGVWRNNDRLDELYNGLKQVQAGYTGDNDPALRSLLFGVFRDAIDNLRSSMSG